MKNTTKRLPSGLKTTPLHRGDNYHRLNHLCPISVRKERGGKGNPPESKKKKIVLEIKEGEGKEKEVTDGRSLGLSRPTSKYIRPRVSRPKYTG